MALKPIGTGSRADDHGYTFDVILSWLEEIRSHEDERATGGPKSKLRQRADLICDAVDKLNEADQI